jgi:hypothetical protein
MHLDHLVPIGLRRFGKGLVAQDAGIVDENIGAPEMLDSVVEDGLSAFEGGDVSAIGDRAATFGLDRPHHLLRHRQVGAGAVAGPAEVIDDDRGPFAREQFRVGLAQPAARARDQRHLAVE